MKKPFVLIFLILFFHQKAVPAQSYIHLNARNIETAYGITVAEIVESIALTYLAAFICCHIKFNDTYLNVEDTAIYLILKSNKAAAFKAQFPKATAYEYNPEKELLCNIGIIFDLLKSEARQEWLNALLSSTYLTVKTLERLVTMPREIELIEARALPTFTSNIAKKIFYSLKEKSIFHLTYLTEQESSLIDNLASHYNELSCTFEKIPQRFIDPLSIKTLLNVSKKYLRKYLDMLFSKIALASLSLSSEKFIHSLAIAGLGKDRQEHEKQLTKMQKIVFSHRKSDAIINDTINWIRNFRIFQEEKIADLSISVA